MLGNLRITAGAITVDPALQIDHDGTAYIEEPADNADGALGLGKCLGETVHMLREIITNLVESLRAFRSC